MGKHEFYVTQVVIKNKQDVINLVNPLGGEHERAMGWIF